MKKLCTEYAAVFDEIEENPSCTIQWHSAKHAVVGRPQFIPLDRRKRLQHDVEKSEEPADADTKLVANSSREVLHPASCQLDSTETNLESVNSGDGPMELLPQDNIADVYPRTDLPNTLAKHQENEPQLDRCIANDNQQNSDEVSVNQAVGDGHKSAIVVSNDAVLQENPQALSTDVPGTGH